MRSVDVRVRTDEHIVAEHGRMAVAAADQRVLHHDAALADLDAAVLRRQHGAEQHARPGADVHVAAQHGRRRDVRVRMDVGPPPAMFDLHPVEAPDLDVSGGFASFCHG